MELFSVKVGKIVSSGSAKKKAIETMAFFYIYLLVTEWFKLPQTANIINS